MQAQRWKERQRQLKFAEDPALEAAYVNVRMIFREKYKCGNQAGNMAWAGQSWKGLDGLIG